VTATNNAGLVSTGTNATNPFALTADSTAPGRVISFPANGGRYNATSWTAGCASAGICGTASDAGAGVASVSVTIRRLSDNSFWNGSSWQPASVTLTATGTTSWSSPLDAGNFTNGVSYTVTAFATDHVGNQSTTVSSTFTYDTTPPVVLVTLLANGGGASKVTTTGTATPGDGDVTVYLCHVAACSAANAVYVGTATVSVLGTWSDTSGNIGKGTYYAVATQTDTAGNTGTSNVFGPFIR
jgi:hypothetical protein